MAANLPQQNYDHQQLNDQINIPESPEFHSTVPQLSESNTIPPLASSRGRRKKSKPRKYGFSQTDVQDKPLSSKPKTVVHDPPSAGLSSQEPNSATKDLKTLAQSSPAVLRAREVQSTLGSEHPSFIKLLVGSYVTTYLSLPTTFCKTYLPKDTTLVLEDQDEEQYELKYFAYKCRLRIGWRKFAAAHNLLEGDVLIFQLVEPLKFKVYITRGNELEDVNGPGILLDFGLHTEQTTTEIVTPCRKTKKQKSLHLMEVQNKQNVLATPPQVSSHPINSEEVGSEVLESSRSFKSSPSFQEVKAFEDFSIVVNGRCIDSELPVEVRKDYYELCLAKKKFLHDALPDGIYYKLVAGMIGEIVYIANGIKSCKVSTPKEKFEAWDNSLKSFRLLGMEVEFIRDRIDALVKLAFQSDERLYVNKCEESKEDKKRLDDEIKELEERIMEMRAISGALEMLTNSLRERVGNFEVMFRQEVDAPW